MTSEMDPIALLDLNWNTKQMIGEGCFGGEVYETAWSYTKDNGHEGKEPVVVVNFPTLSRQHILALRDEWSRLSDKNILELLGWCQVSKSQHPMLVFEHSRDGDLWNYLHRHAGDELTFGVMKKMALDIARGMKYLHEKNIVLGDLAARNCIVYRPRSGDDEWEVKVGSNAYYSTNFEGCYCTQAGVTVRCPVRWMAPENLPCLNGENMVPSSHKKSKEGDVWAFGVVLFEIWTRGEFPFGGLTDKKVCSMVLGGGKATNYAHDRLNECMGTVWQTMHSCWQPSPIKRPKFSTIVSILEEPEDESEPSDYDDDYYHFD